MIAVSISERGFVKLVPRKHSDIALIRDLKYCAVRDDGLGVCFWPYIKDVLRDIPRHLRSVDKDLKKTLSVILDNISDAKERHTVEDTLKWFRQGTSPYKFQAQSISFIIEMRTVLLADATGLGKSISSLGAALGAFYHGEADRAIFIVPTSLKNQWHDEIMKFSSPDLISRGVAIANGNKAKRRRIYKSNWRILITSPGIVVNDAHDLSRIRGIDFVVLDEASCIRNPDVKIARAVKDVFGKTKFRVALTATPVENKLSDLFSILEWVNGRVFPSRSYFDERYVHWVNKRITVRKMTRRGLQTFPIVRPVISGYRNLEEVPMKLSSVYMRRRVADVGLELPTCVCNWEIINLSKAERQIYDECKNAEEYSESLRDEAVRSWLQGLIQACNSAELVSKGKKIRSSKIARLKHLLETELFGEQVIVFTDYERFASMIARELPMRVALFTGKNKKTRQSAINSFKLGERRVLVATSAGERGLNLQNASVVVNIDLPFNPARLKQRIGRIMRINSKNDTVRMINFVTKDTVEDTIIRRAIYMKRKLDEDIFGTDSLSDADPLKNLRSDLSRL